MKEKICRIVRNFRKSAKHSFALWLPAAVLLVFAVVLAFFVSTSKDGSFKGCGAQLFVCMGDEIEADLSLRKMTRMTSCAYRTVWCDARVVWGKVSGEEFLPPDLSPAVALPPIDEKADKELFDKLTRQEYLDEQFKKFDNLPPSEVFPEDVKALMDQARQERLKLEKEIEEQNKALLEQLENKSGQNAQ